MKPKDSRRKETTKMTVGINEIEVKETIEKWVSNNIWSYDNWIYFKVDKNLNLQIQKRTTNPSNKVVITKKYWGISYK